jgi:hypothetical protein
MWCFFVMGIAFALTLMDSVAWTLGLAGLLWWAALRAKERWKKRNR